jgi:hypothetical protein
VDDEQGKIKNVASRRGRPLAIDPEAKSAQEGVPAFIARPPDARIYYGFPILGDVQVDGFAFGMISDFEAAPDMSEGDAFVVAPDDSRAGLVWEISDKSYFEEVMPIETERWGVWAVSFPYPMRTREDALRNLQTILPKLKEKRELWREERA